jgi:hypothetical protein
MTGTKKRRAERAGAELMRLVKAHFAARGETYTAWAKAHGYSPQIVSFAILHQHSRGILGPRVRDELYAEMGVESRGKNGGGQ